ncbi:MAG TPA: TMEM175 family protein [Candidatus Tumulicola sp.]|nr:TMEM175 family protein [Candidatus Tumulicola sp.]
MNKGRLEAFSDGVFAIAITLLVLELRVPDLKGTGDSALAAALLAQWPQYLVYAVSFAMIGIMWLNHHAIFQNIEKVSYALLMSNLLLLMAISFLPYPTLVLAHYGPTPITILFYGIVLTVIALAYRALFFAADPPPDVPAIIGYLTQWNPWTTVGLLSYLAAIALGWYNPLVSIGLFAAVAVFYALPSSITIALRRGRHGA